MLNQNRLQIQKVAVTALEDNRSKIEVVLAKDDQLFQGEALSIDNEEEQLAGVAEATLKAIEASVAPHLELKLLYNKQIFLAELSKVIFFVIIQLKDESATIFLPGICLYSVFTLEVATKATLSALNRNLAKYI